MFSVHHLPQISIANRFLYGQCGLGSHISQIQDVAVAPFGSDYEKGVKGTYVISTSAPCGVLMSSPNVATVCA